MEATQNIKNKMERCEQIKRRILIFSSYRKACLEYFGMRPIYNDDKHFKTDIKLLECENGHVKARTWFKSKIAGPYKDYVYSDFKLNKI